MPTKATKSKTAVIRAPDQKLGSMFEIQDPQNIQNCQSEISGPMSKLAEKNTPRITGYITTRSTGIARSELNLINPPLKVRTLVGKMPLLF